VKQLLASLPLLAPLALVGCSGDDGDGATLQVLAAASLTESFEALEAEFEARNEGVDVQLQFGSSTDLAGTVADGAPGDVLATADETSMQLAVDAGVTAEEPAAFAENELVIVTAPGNPAGVRSLADLDGLDWVRCANDVPCGRVAVTLLDDAGVTAEPVSLEVDVKAALEKVVSGEVDAGLVYRSDAVAAGGDTALVPVEGAEAVPAVYYVAPLAQSPDAALADAWIDLVESEAGREELSAAGFRVP
jgi:molybdate transport system substrate-binding protein